MRIAVFGDFNGEHRWLSRLLRQCREEGVDTFVCHGDIVDNARRPDFDAIRRCVYLLRSAKVRCIKGNHEEDLLSSGALDGKLYGFFAGLPRALTLEGVPEAVFTHRSVSGRFLIRATAGEFHQLRRRYPQSRIAFFGHSHMRFHHSTQDGRIHPNYRPKFDVPYDVSSGLHLVNTGTTNISLPFTFNLTPGYVIYDSSSSTIVYRRIAV